LKEKFEELKENEDEVEEVKRVAESERKAMMKHKSDVKEEITAAQIEAAKIIIKNLRILIERRKQAGI